MRTSYTGAAFHWYDMAWFTFGELSGPWMQSGLKGSKCGNRALDEEDTAIQNEGFSFFQDQEW